MIMKNEYLLIFSSAFFYFLLLALLRFGYNFNGDWISLILGGLAGTAVLEADHFLYTLYTKPDEAISAEAREFLDNKRYGYFFNSVMAHREERIELSLHSALFAGVIILLTIFTITSTGSFLGAGLVLGLYLRYLLDAYEVYRKDPARLNRILFWQLKGIISEQQLKIFLFIILGGFIFSSILFIR